MAKKHRKRKKQRSRGAKAAIVIFRILLVLIIAAILAALAGALYAQKVIEENAEEIDTSEIYELVNQRSTLYDADGNKIEDLYFTGGNRDILEYDEMPQTLINAVVSIEDKTFWEHKGFNVIRMIGALKERVLGGGQIRGTSTITQQLARNVYLADTKSERSLQRKIVEAWYTKQIEEELSKKQIMEAYLNTVYFGFDSYGIEAAANNYFSKHASELTDAECVALAALPQSPDVYALIRYTENGDTEYNGDKTDKRRKLVLSLMEENGYITAAEKKEIAGTDLKELVDLERERSSATSYYTDYAIGQVTEDLALELGITEQEARQVIYTKGLSIYTCLDPSMQKILDEEINDSSNYTGISSYRTDSSNNILSSSGSVVARPYSSYFNDEGTFRLKESEFSKNDDGSLTIYKGKRLALYETENGVNISFRTLYTLKDGTLRLIEGGSLAIPEEYTSFDDDDNCVISAEFIENNQDFFASDEDKLKITKDHYTLAPEMKQPQAAAAIMENETGRITAMSGGRGSSGRQLYNRAVNPRQPGSSIKPIAVYAPALQLSVEAAAKGEAMKLDNSDGSSYGKYITAGSIINDSKVTVDGRVWPRNSYGGYKGKMTLRQAVTLSCNVVSYKVFKQIGIDNSIRFLKESGITTLVEEGASNDLSPASLSLGGMTKGISPLEMTAAYAVFPNGGVYKKPQFYTEVLDNEGDAILQASAEEMPVYDEGVAFIMTDMLQDVVTKGTGTSAKISGQPVGGKTGTTSSQYDIWFAGFSPQYSMALWEGNDVNLPLTNMSTAAASFWATIMERICTDSAEFSPMPADVEKIKDEYYVKGTYPVPTSDSSGTDYTVQGTTQSTAPGQGTYQTSPGAPSEPINGYEEDYEPEWY